MEENIKDKYNRKSQNIFNNIHLLDYDSFLYLFFINNLFYIICKKSWYFKKKNLYIFWKFCSFIYMIKLYMTKTLFS